MTRKYSVFLNITTEVSKEEYADFMQKKSDNIELMPDPTSDGYIAGADYKVVVEADEHDSDTAWKLGEEKVFEEHAHEFPVDSSRLDVGHNRMCYLENEKKYAKRYEQNER